MVTKSTRAPRKTTPSASSPPPQKTRVLPVQEHAAPEPWKPHAYQRKAMRFVLEHPQAALFLDPGLGKTAVTLGTISVLKKQMLTRGALVIAPLRVAVSVWPEEVARWADFRHLSIAVLHGKERENLAAEPHDIYVTNFDSLPWLIESGTLGRWFRNGWVDHLVIDELSKFKHPRTQRFKLLRPWLQKFRRRLGLTGSPAPNSLMDLFGQVYVLDRGARLGQYITHYRQNYFVPDGLYGWKIKEGAERLIYTKLADVALRMDAKDHLELPPKVDNIIRVNLPPKAAAVYREMENEMIAVLDTERVTASSAAAVSGKCRQIANGALYADPIDPITGEPKGGKREWLPVHDAKLEALADLADELQGAPMLVAYEFQHDLARLLKRFPGTPHIGGGVSTTRSKELEAAWNSNALPLLFVHPASVGHGLNLQRGGAAHVCWFGLTWDFELYDQLNRRLLRQGSTADRIMVHHLVARDTVDEVVMGVLRAKRRTQDALLDALRRRR